MTPSWLEFWSHKAPCCSGGTHRQGRNTPGLWEGLQPRSTPFAATFLCLRGIWGGFCHCLSLTPEYEFVHSYCLREPVRLGMYEQAGTKEGYCWGSRGVRETRWLSLFISYWTLQPCSHHPFSIQKQKDLSTYKPEHPPSLKHSHCARERIHPWVHRPLLSHSLPILSSPDCTSKALLFPPTVPSLSWGGLFLTLSPHTESPTLPGRLFLFQVPTEESLSLRSILDLLLNLMLGPPLGSTHCSQPCLRGELGAGQAGIGVTYQRGLATSYRQGYAEWQLWGGTCPQCYAFKGDTESDSGMLRTS